MFVCLWIPLFTHVLTFFFGFCEADPKFKYFWSRFLSKVKGSESRATHRGTHNKPHKTHATCHTPANLKITREFSNFKRKLPILGYKEIFHTTGVPVNLYSWSIFNVFALYRVNVLFVLNLIVFGGKFCRYEIQTEIYCFRSYLTNDAVSLAR